MFFYYASTFYTNDNNEFHLCEECVSITLQLGRVVSEDDGDEKGYGNVVQQSMYCLYFLYGATNYLQAAFCYSKNEAVLLFIVFTRIISIPCEHNLEYV